MTDFNDLPDDTPISLNKIFGFGWDESKHPRAKNGKWTTGGADISGDKIGSVHEGRRLEWGPGGSKVWVPRGAGDRGGSKQSTGIQKGKYSELEALVGDPQSMKAAGYTVESLTKEAERMSFSSDPVKSKAGTRMLTRLRRS